MVNFNVGDHGPFTVEVISPMKRGLKCGRREVAGRNHCVEVISPMKRGLKFGFNESCQEVCGVEVISPMKRGLKWSGLHDGQSHRHALK